MDCGNSFIDFIFFQLDLLCMRDKKEPWYPQSSTSTTEDTTLILMHPPSQSRPTFSSSSKREKMIISRYMVFDRVARNLVLKKELFHASKHLVVTNNKIIAVILCCLFFCVLLLHLLQPLKYSLNTSKNKFHSSHNRIVPPCSRHTWYQEKKHKLWFSMRKIPNFFTRIVNWLSPYDWERILKHGYHF